MVFEYRAISDFDVLPPAMQSKIEVNGRHMPQQTFCKEMWPSRKA